MYTSTFSINTSKKKIAFKKKIALKLLITGWIS